MEVKVITERAVRRLRATAAVLSMLALAAILRWMEAADAARDAAGFDALGMRTHAEQLRTDALSTERLAFAAVVEEIRNDDFPAAFSGRQRGRHHHSDRADPRGGPT